MVFEGKGLRDAERSRGEPRSRRICGYDQESLLLSSEKSGGYGRCVSECLLKVAINACKDYLKNFFRRSVVSFEVLREVEADEQEDHREVLAAVLALPGKYKDVIYLHYYEGYSAGEIGKILGKKENTVYSLLSRGRGMLKEMLGGDGIDE